MHAANIGTWTSFTSEASMDVSSCSSLAAALSSGSFSSTKPPGRAHCP